MKDLLSHRELPGIVPGLAFQAMPLAARTDQLGSLPLLRIRQLEEYAKRTRAGTVCALTLLLDLKDMKIGSHATRLAEWAVRVGETLGIRGEDLRDLEHASMLHDIGKIGVPEEILGKPGPLTEEEFAEVRKHPEYGWAILRAIPDFERLSLLVLHHHERLDGKGYPGGLKGEEIPLGARIVAVVDAFDAMISDRCYRRGLPAEEAFRRLRESSGDQFDPRIVEPFIDLARCGLEGFDRLAEPAA